MFIRFLLFGMLGIFATLLFTAVAESVAKRKWDFTGHASLILFPLYGLIAILYPLIALRLGGVPWYVRGIIYMLAFFLVQLVVGWALTRWRICPWSYAKGWSLAGLVRLTDAPIWFVAGLIVEWIYPFVQGTAYSLS